MWLQALSRPSVLGAGSAVQATQTLLLQTEAPGLWQSTLVWHWTHVFIAAEPAPAVVLQTGPPGLPVQSSASTHSTQPTPALQAVRPGKAPQAVSSMHTAQVPFWQRD